MKNITPGKLIALIIVVVCGAVLLSICAYSSYFAVGVLSSPDGSWFPRPGN